MYTALTESDESRRPYNICVITAASEYQARGYRAQLEWRMSRCALPEKTEFLVIPDPHGKRIGSGGSTIYVLYRLLERYCRIGSGGFENMRILILHSGGDSRRLPAYSAVGKIFIPLPVTLSSGANGFVSLFDILLRNFMELPYQDGGQMVVAAGDTLLSFDTSEVAFSPSGVTGLAYPGAFEVAEHHGVYIAPRTPSGNPREVLDFLQKPAYSKLEECGGFDTTGRAFIDTGVMNFGIDAIEALMKASGISLKNGEIVLESDSLCEKLINAKAQLDVYQEIPFAMLGKNIENDSMSSLEALQEIPFSVCLLSHCEFFHVGTSRNLIENFHTINYTASLYGFRNFDKTRAIDKSGLDNAFVYNSLVDTPSAVADGLSFIEGCHLDGEVHLAGDNILTGVPEGAGSIELPEGICVACMPVSRESRSGWVSVIYGVEDSFKGSAEDGGNTFLNRAFSDWMEDGEISATDLWAADELHEMWNSKLFPFSTDPAESVRTALSIQGNHTADRSSFSSWKNSSRMSLQEILQSIDYYRFLDNCSDLIRKVSVENLGAMLTPKSDLSSEEILSWCKEPGDYIRAAEIMLDLIQKTDDVLFKARLYKLLSSILDAGNSMLDARYEYLPSAEYRDRAFGLVREAIGKGLEDAEFINSPDRRLQIRSDEVVWVCAPARVDLAGGWSDTPPYCLERGGGVLNAAVKLNGQYPIQVIGKICSEPVIRVNSIDLESNVIISDTSELMSFSDPGDWLSLPKSALVAAGVISRDERRDLREILEEFGGGMDITLFSAVPSGSGLGTSSILGSAIIACLSRMFGMEITQNELFNRTLYMEQLMTTGGGWQDQVGGVVGGVKLIQTEPGLFQSPVILWTDLTLPGMKVSDRFLVYYTGYRRMAKNILQRIVGNYLDRDPATLRLIARNQQLAVETKAVLDRRDIDAFGEKLAEVWELQKTLDPGTSNEQIEEILDRISNYICGAKLLGAGGGGFLFIVTKGSEHSQRIREILEKAPPNDRARFFDPDVDQEGLKVSVL